MKKLFLNVIALFTILLVVGTAGVVEAAVSYTVQGTVSSSSGTSIAGLRVKIIEKRMNGENLLTEANTSASGNYSTSFQGNSPINIGAQVYNGQTLLGSSEIHYNASRREIINVKINTQPVSRPSFFDDIINSVTSFVSGITSNFKIPSKKEIKSPTSTPTPTNSVISPTTSPTPSFTPTPTKSPTPTPTSVPLPDLTIEAKEFSNNILPVTLKNIGRGHVVPIGSSQATDVKVRATWEDKDHHIISTNTKQLLDRDVMYFLGAGKSFEVLFSDIPWTATYYTVNINVPATFKESDADVGGQGANNQITGSIPQADLTVESVVFQPQTRRPIVTIKNIGRRIANFTNFTTFASMAYERTNTTSLYKDVVSVFQYSSSANPAYVHPGDSTQVAFGPPPNGAIRYTAGVNENGSMPEGNVSNNYLQGDDIPQPSPTPTPTSTATPTPTRTPTPTPTPTAKPTNTPTPSPLPTDTPIPTNSPTVIPTSMTEPNSPNSSSTPALDDQSKIITSLNYPIAELGNCQSEEDCSNYCDNEENVSKCTDFAVKKGLMTQEESDLAKNAANTTNGPGSCGDIKSCAAFCDKPENINACLDYAKSNNLMNNEELVDAKKVMEIINGNSKTPGDCQTPDQCQEYCADESHLDECLNFGEESGLMSTKESDEAKKIQDALQKGGPGGCHSSEECDSYCSDENHYEECNGFFEKAGIITSEENQGSQTENAVEDITTTPNDDIKNNPAPTEEPTAVESPAEEQSPTEEPAVEGVSTKHFLFDPLINWFRHLGK